MSFSIYSASPMFGGQAPSPALADGWQVPGISSDCIPALSGTLVQLELLLRCDPIDLESVTRLVRSDLGLSIQALRASRWAAAPNDELWRISDCVIHLGPRLLELAPPLIWAEDRKHAYAEAEAFWKHAKLVATVAEMTAAYFEDLEVSPEQAYISGLVHNLTRMPQILSHVGFTNDLGCNQDWMTDLNLPPFMNEVITSIHKDRHPGAMTGLSRVVSFARLWIDLCLPWSETCMAKRKRFTLPLLRAATLISRFFPDTSIDPFVPFIGLLRDATLNDLEEERLASSSVLQQRSPGFQSWLDSSG
jgi:hypothetical protein